MDVDDREDAVSLGISECEREVDDFFDNMVRYVNQPLPDNELLLTFRIYGSTGPELCTQPLYGHVYLCLDSAYYRLWMGPQRPE